MPTPHRSGTRRFVAHLERFIRRKPDKPTVRKPQPQRPRRHRTDDAPAQ